MGGIERADDEGHRGECLWRVCINGAHGHLGGLADNQAAVVDQQAAYQQGRHDRPRPSCPGPGQVDQVPISDGAQAKGYNEIEREREQAGQKHSQPGGRLPDVDRCHQNRVEGLRQDDGCTRGGQ
jgi:hypothetical protein